LGVGLGVGFAVGVLAGLGDGDAVGAAVAGAAVGSGDWVGHRSRAGTPAATGEPAARMASRAASAAVNGAGRNEEAVPAKTKSAARAAIPAVLGLRVKSLLGVRRDAALSGSGPSVLGEPGSDLLSRWREASGLRRPAG